MLLPSLAKYGINLQLTQTLRSHLLWEAQRVFYHLPRSLTTKTRLENTERSLFDELFSESTQTGRRNGEATTEEADDLASFNFANDLGGPNFNVGDNLEIVDSTPTPPYRLWDLAILVLSRASSSLLNDDFRRIAPRGHHIDDWKGPGDILKGELHMIITQRIVG